MNKYKIIKFTDNEFELDVNVSPEEGTVWLTKEEMALLFGRDRTVISRHINNIYKEGELERELVCAKNARTGPDGKKYIVDYYNLDVVISVGYRVKSKRGVMFRKWATNVLKQYLLKGYVLDKDRIIISKDNLVNLENDIAYLKEEVAGIKEKVFVEPIKQKIFFDGSFFDAYEFITSLVSKAKNKVVIVDPYFDIKGLNVFKNASNEVDRVVYLSKKAKLLDYDVEQFKKQYGNIQVWCRETFHDRFLILDDCECYILGTSLNYIGNKTFGVNKVEDEIVIKGILKGLDE